MGYNFLWVKAAVLVLLHLTVHAGPSRRLENWSLSEHIKEPYYGRSGIVRLFACRLAMGFYAHSPMDLRSLGIHVFFGTRLLGYISSAGRDYALLGYMI